MQNACQISVIIPVYNTAEYLREAIGSIQNQTFRDLEIIAVDDCSTDDSYRVLSEIAEKDSRVKVFRNAHNSKIARTLNFALDHCDPCSKYIARMDSDDISLPTRLQEQFDFMEQHQDIDISGTYYELFGARELIIKHPTRHEKMVEYMCLGISPLAHPTVIFRRSFLDAANIRYKLAYCDDYELWTRCLRKHQARFANIPKVLLRYRLHNNQLTNMHSKTFLKRAAVLQKQLFKELPLSKKIKYSITRIKRSKISNYRRWLIQIKFKRNAKVLRLFGIYLINSNKL